MQTKLFVLALLGLTVSGVSLESTTEYNWMPLQKNDARRAERGEEDGERPPKGEGEERPPKGEGEEGKPPRGGKGGKPPKEEEALAQSEYNWMPRQKNDARNAQ